MDDRDRHEVIEVVVSVDRHDPQAVSQLALGVTHAQYSLDEWGHPEAVARGKGLLRQVARYQNQHLMGWGAHNPWPDPQVRDPEAWDWASLDQRIAMMRETGGQLVVTLCGAPTWMVDPHWTGGTDWAKLEWAPLPRHEQDFAFLAQQVARRYPDVSHFQVWNELKGFWKQEANNWDIARYTRFYNQVYTAIKTVRPAAQVGGPYLVIEGTGTAASGKGRGWAAAAPLTARNREVLDYWLTHKQGAEFLCLDRGVQRAHDKAAYDADVLLGLTPWFAEVVAQVRARPGYQGEPIWFAEDYFVGRSDWQFQAVGLASMLYHELQAGVAVSLRWAPQAQTEGANNQNLWTDTRSADGGQPLPNYDVYLAFHTHFPHGTPLYRTTVSDQNVEVLASATAILLLNKRPTAVAVLLEGARLMVDRYGVVVINQ